MSARNVYPKTDLVIVFKTSNRSNAKTKIKVFKSKTIDDLIDSLKDPKKKIAGIPTKAEFVQIGIGSSFEERWKKKYKL